MGNIKGWGGPITLEFLHNELLLNKEVWGGGIVLAPDRRSRDELRNVPRPARLRRLRARRAHRPCPSLASRVEGLPERVVLHLAVVDQLRAALRSREAVQ